LGPSIQNSLDSVTELVEMPPNSRARVIGAGLVISGGPVSVVAAILVWLPTYLVYFSGPPPSGGCACILHLVTWPVLVFWISGALVPFFGFVSRPFWGVYAAYTFLVALSSAGLAANIMLIWAPYPPGIAAAPGIIALLLIMTAGYAAQITGLFLRGHFPAPRKAGTKTGVQSPG
jgi:hypothetical protein